MEEPLIEFIGHNGRVELYKDFVRFDRETGGRYFGTSFSEYEEPPLQGKKDIYFKDVIYISLVEPARTIGWLAFPLSIEEKERIDIGGLSYRNENGIIFDKKENYSKAIKIANYIERKMIKAK